jgi:hypothetical protein
VRCFKVQLAVNELYAGMYQEFTTPTDREVEVEYIRPHLAKYGNPAGSLQLKICGADGAIIAESALVSIASITSASGTHFHGYVRFAIKAALRRATSYRLYLVGSGYTFSEASYIGWCLDHGLRKYEATYTNNTGVKSPMLFEVWGWRRTYSMRVLDFLDGFTVATAPTSVLTAAAGLATYSSDAAFVAAKGTAAANGDAYYNTSDLSIHLYNSSAWRSFREHRIVQNSFTIANNQGVAAAVTGLLLPAETRTAVIDYQIYRLTTSTGAVEILDRGQITVNHYAASWAIDWTSTGPNNVGVEFSITSGGQVNYVSSNIAGTPNTSEMKFIGTIFT